MLSSLDAVIGPARAAGVPVFTSVPGCAARGALFDLGADYHRVGESIGRLAGRVLDGESPADMPILYEVPPEFWINRVCARGRWAEVGRFPPRSTPRPTSWSRRAGRSGATRARSQLARPPGASRPSRTWKVGVAAFSESTILEEGIDGFRRGLKEAGLVEGKDFTMTYRNAQGDIATLNALFDELNGDDTDLIVSFSTPALQAARTEGRP